MYMQKKLQKSMIIKQITFFYKKAIRRNFVKEISIKYSERVIKTVLDVLTTGKNKIKDFLIEGMHILIP